MELQTANPATRLVPIDVTRDAPRGVEWLAGNAGRETLRLMGVTEADNHASDLESEQKRLRDILADPNEKAWMIQYEDTIVGIVEIHYEATRYLPAPNLSVMIGDPAARGKGIGTGALGAVLTYLQHEGYRNCYARHLVGNTASAALLASSGFTDENPPYADADGLQWQNMRRQR